VVRQIVRYYLHVFGEVLTGFQMGNFSSSAANRHFFLSNSVCVGVIIF
jgi:hypothetical protein